VDRRNFRLLVGSSACSNLADGILQTVVPLLALSITRDPGAFATVALAGRLPWLLVALPAGALVDRWDRRRTMVAVNLGRFVLLGLLTLIVANGGQELWMLAAVAFILGIGETFFDTAAQSIVPALVQDSNRLETANSRLYGVELTANQFVGPAVGGLIAGAALAAGVGAATTAYLVGAGALATITGAFRARRAAERAPRSTIRRDIADGTRYLAHHQLLRSLALIVGISNLSSSIAFTVFPLYAVSPGPMGLTSTGFGLALAALAVGSLAGTFLATPLIHRLGQRRTLLVSMAASAGMYLAPATTANVAAVVTSFVVASSLSISWNIVTVSLRQRIVPAHLLGRVNASYRLVAWGTMPIGAALGGLIASHTSLTTAFWISAALGLTTLPIIWTQVTESRLDAHHERDGIEPLDVAVQTHPAQPRPSRG
jgi:MFS family permease